MKTLNNNTSFIYFTETCSDVKSQLPVWSELSNNNNTNKNTANFSEFQVYCFPLSGARQYLH